MSTPAPVAPAESAVASVPPPMTALQSIPIGDIVPSPLNPRQHFGDLTELAASIRLHGVRVPLLTRERHGRHEVVDGERRYRAAKAAGTLFLPVIPSELTDAQVLELQLLTAGQREGLTPLEEARGYRRLLKENPSKYSTAYIADRISRSEKYVADRMRLLDLIAPLQQLLDDERIGVGHAELLAKLKPEDQTRAIKVGDGSRFNHKDDGGLWDRVGQTLAFGGADDAAVDPYADLKPVTVKELEAWIARHVRFDVEHMAKTAPLEYGATAGHIQAAETQPGRGKKVIAITTDYRVQDDARDPSERVFGVGSWKRADGSTGTTGLGNGKMADSPTCDHAVLGVFAVGPGYGTTLRVCVARDKCKVHFKKEIAEREKNAKLRASGQGAKADAREKKTAETWDERQRREKAERAIALGAYRAVHQPMLDALAAAVPTVFDRRMFDLVIEEVAPHTYKPPTTLAIADMPLALVMAKALVFKPEEWGAVSDFAHLSDLLAHFGVDVAPFRKTFKAHMADAKKAAAPKKVAKATTLPAAKAVKKKAAKRQ